MGNSGAKSSLLHTEATATSNPDSMNMEIPSYNTEKDVHVQNYQVQEEIPESSLSSGNEVSQSVNHCEKVDSSSMSISPASVQDKETVLICNKPKINHAPMTLAQYRKTVGIKVVNQKSSQKIGIVANSISVQEPGSNRNTVVPAGKGSLCPFCGYTSSLTSKCERCARTFSSDRVKIVDLAPVAVKIAEASKTPVMPQLSKESFYGSRRPRHQAITQVRQGRSKTEEPQCVTLSSDDEEDSCPEAKKIKSQSIDDAQPVACDSLQVAPSDSSVCNKNYSADLESADPVSSSPTNPSSIDPSCPILESLDASGLASNDTLDSDKDTALARWKEGGLKGPFSAVSVRSARVGSYKCVPTDRVLLSSEGISLKIPIMKDGRPSKTESVNVAIPTKNMLDVQVHFSRTLSVIFLRTAPSVSRNVSKALGLSKGPTVPYWDQLSEQESQKRLTLLPHDLDETSKNAIKQAFALSGIYKEINAIAANDILVKSSPQDHSLPADIAVTPAESPALLSSTNYAANKENGFKVEIRTRSSSKAAVRPTSLPVERMFSWSDGPDRYSVTTEDYTCLNQDNLLNDSIIDFYLRYVFSTKLDDDQKKKCYVFSSFFYQRLTTRPPRVSGRKHPIEDDANLDIAEKRHSRVKSWTKKVDIFEKDFLIIPINERAHWFLAIVCFAGLSGPVTMKDNRPVDIPNQQQTYPKKACRKPFNKLPHVATGESFMIGNTTVTPVGGSNKGLKSSTVISVDTDRDEAESDDEGVPCSNDNVTLDSAETYEPIKQPCILFFDSMASSSHFRVAATLRDYLKIEYQVKRSNTSVINGSGTGHSCGSHHKLFSKEVMLSACPSVPQQNNSYDCGVFVLQYAEAFMKKPLSDFYLHKIQLSKWFTTCMANRKRKDIQYLLIRLTKEKNNSADSILRLLPENDVRIALQTQNQQNAENLLWSTQVTANTFQRDPTEDVEMEEKAPEVIPKEESVSLEDNLCESHPEDNVFMEN